MSEDGLVDLGKQMLVTFDRIVLTKGTPRHGNANLRRKYCNRL